MKLEKKVRARLLALSRQHDELDALVVQERLAGREPQFFEAIDDERGVGGVALPLVSQRSHRPSSPRIEAEQGSRVIRRQPAPRQACRSGRRRSNQQIEKRLPHASRQYLGGRCALADLRAHVMPGTNEFDHRLDT